MITPPRQIAISCNDSHSGMRHPAGKYGHGRSATTPTWHHAPSRIAPALTSLLLALAALCTGGCMLKPMFQVDPCLVPTVDSSGARETMLRRFDGTPYIEPLIEQKLIEKYEAAPPSEKRARRNDIIGEALLRCDEICANHKSSIVSQSVIQKLTLGIAGIGLSAAGGLVTTGAANVLSATSTAVQGTDKAISTDVYNDKVSTAIVTAIETDQIKKKTAIDARRTGDPQYSVFDGLDDVQQYHASCSFSAGLGLVQSDVAAANSKARNLAQELRTTVFVADESGNALLKFWMPNGKDVDSAHQEAILGWLSSHGQGDLPISVVAGSNDPDAVKLRKQLVADLKIPVLGK